MQKDHSSWTQQPALIYLAQFVENCIPIVIAINYEAITDARQFREYIEAVAS
jgi:hypothetical protein